MELKDKVLRIYIFEGRADLAEVANKIIPDNPRESQPINPLELIPIRDQLVQEGYIRPVRDHKDKRDYKEPFIPYEAIW